MQDTSYTAIQSLTSSEREKIDWMINNMNLNKAYIYASKNLNKIEKRKVLENFKNNYLNYRLNWKGQPKKCFDNKIFGENFKNKNINILCLDIELASICDLACPHCFRQFVPTPDKIMSKELAFKLIDEASIMNIPSMKFNWRGEPLLNPKASEIIKYAKKKGILETIINTNATMLTNSVAEKLIDSGLDLMIYSFDGGTKNSYEKMRPGRFKDNNFEDVIKNIKNFAILKKKKNSVFPRTKIQMVLTKDTRSELDSFLNIFKECVDDVSVKQYSERGGKLEDINEEMKEKLIKKLGKNVKDLDPQSSVMLDSENNIYISSERLPCEQPFQRLLITYDGKVSMCCYDWGVEHSVGFVDDLAINNGTIEYDKILEKSQKKVKSFELMNLRKINNYSKPLNKACSLDKIWNNKEINNVRKLHINNSIEDLEICKKCTFKDTYKWIKQ